MLKAALLGLGNIAWKFGKGASHEQPPLTHAEAFSRHTATRLIAGCSPDAGDRVDFSRYFGLPVYNNAEELLTAEKPDIVSICSPTEGHFAQICLCIRAGVPMIWLEKPPAASLNEIECIIKLLEETQTKTSILVNYQRRYTCSYNELRNIYRERILGHCKHIAIIYSRGLAANGSHMIDMLFHIVGDEQKIKITGVMGQKHNPSFVIDIEDGSTANIIGIELPYHCIDITLTCDNGRASVLHGGMTTRLECRVEHELFPGFHRLREVDAHKLGPGGFGNSMLTALEDLLSSHYENRRPVSNLWSALRTMQVMETVDQAQA